MLSLFQLVTANICWCEYNILFFILFFIVLLSVGLYTTFIAVIIVSFSHNLGPQNPQRIKDLSCSYRYVNKCEKLINSEGEMQSMIQFLKKDGTYCSSHCMSLQHLIIIQLLLFFWLKKYGIIYVMC